MIGSCVLVISLIDLGEDIKLRASDNSLCIENVSSQFLGVIQCLRMRVSVIL